MLTKSLSALAFLASDLACSLGVLGLVPLGVKGVRYVSIISSKSDISWSSKVLATEVKLEFYKSWYGLKF